MDKQERSTIVTTLVMLSVMLLVKWLLPEHEMLFIMMCRIGTVVCMFLFAMACRRNLYLVGYCLGVSMIFISMESADIWNLWSVAVMIVASISMQVLITVQNTKWYKILRRKWRIQKLKFKLYKSILR